MIIDRAKEDDSSEEARIYYTVPIRTSTMSINGTDRCTLSFTSPRHQNQKRSRLMEFGLRMRTACSSGHLMSIRRMKLCRKWSPSPRPTWPAISPSFAKQTFVRRPAFQDTGCKGRWVCFGSTWTSLRSWELAGRRYTLLCDWLGHTALKTMRV